MPRPALQHRPAHWPGGAPVCEMSRYRRGAVTTKHSRPSTSAAPIGAAAAAAGASAPSAHSPPAPAQPSSGLWERSRRYSWRYSRPLSGPSSASSEPGARAGGRGGAEQRGQGGARLAAGGRTQSRAVQRQAACAPGGKLQRDRSRLRSCHQARSLLGAWARQLSTSLGSGAPARERWCRSTQRCPGSGAHSASSRAAACCACAPSSAPPQALGRTAPPAGGGAGGGEGGALSWESARRPRGWRGGLACCAAWVPPHGPLGAEASRHRGQELQQLRAGLDATPRARRGERRRRRRVGAGLL